MKYSLRSKEIPSTKPKGFPEVSANLQCIVVQKVYTLQLNSKLTLYGCSARLYCTVVQQAYTVYLYSKFTLFSCTESLHRIVVQQVFTVQFIYSKLTLYSAL